jgi:phage/plasmid primase-like uncharacterized protein
MNDLFASRNQKTGQQEQKTAPLPLQDFLQKCLQDMEHNEIPFKGPVEVDAKHHRFPVGGSKTKKDGWYIASECSTTGYYCCTYGNWSTGVKHTFRSWENQPNGLGAEEKRAIQAAVEEHQRVVRENLREQHDRVAIQAQEIWNGATLTPPDQSYSAYAIAKGITPFGARFAKNPHGYPALVVPFSSTEGVVRTLQFISMGEATSYKTFLTEGQKRGNFFLIGEILNGESICVVEGFATACSVHEATNGPVVVAGDCGNLEPVIVSLRRVYPENKIIIAGDDDPAGRKKADWAAVLGDNCLCVFPVFPEAKKISSSGKAFTDFNDLHQVCGIEEVRLQLGGASTPQGVVELKRTADALLEKVEPCGDFTTAELPKLLRDYIDSLSATTAAHPVMITASVLGSIAAHFKTNVYMPKNQPWQKDGDGYFQQLHVNLWMLCIASSGGFKTTAQNIGARLAQETSSEARREVKRIVQEIEQATQLKDKNKIFELERTKIQASQEDVLFPQKVTSEALLMLLGQGRSGAIFVSEFGAWLQNMEKTHNNDLKALFTELYDVPVCWQYTTKSAGDYILERPCFSICGCSTLPWVKSNLKSDDVSSGFFARFLIFLPPDNPSIPPALPGRNRSFDENAEGRVRLTLANMNPQYVYRLSESASDYFRHFHEKLYQMIRALGEKPKEVLEPYLKRWSPYLLKLAMLMRPFEDPFSDEISETAILAAWSILLPAVKSTVRLFEGSLGESPHQCDCRKVIEWIAKRARDGKPTTWKDIVSSRQLEGGSDQYQRVIQTLVEGGQVTQESKPEKKDWVYRLAV